MEELNLIRSIRTFYPEDKEILNTIKQILINQQEEIERLKKKKQFLHTKWLGLIEEDIPKLQSKLDEYEEVVSELLKNNVVLFAGRVNGKTHFIDTINKLKQVYEKYKI